MKRNKNIKQKHSNKIGLRIILNSRIVNNKQNTKWSKILEYLIENKFQLLFVWYMINRVGHKFLWQSTEFRPIILDNFCDFCVIIVNIVTFVKWSIGTRIKKTLFFYVLLCLFLFACPMCIDIDFSQDSQKIYRIFWSEFW